MHAEYSQKHRALEYSQQQKDWENKCIDEEYEVHLRTLSTVLAEHRELEEYRVH